MNALNNQVARWMYAIPMIMFGVFHFMEGDGMKMMVPEWLPGEGGLFVIITGIALIGAGIAIITGIMANMAGTLLALMLLIFVATLWLPAVIDAPDKATRMGPMTMMLKDIALAAGALLAGRVATEGS